MIVKPIPASAKYIPVSAVFTGIFNTPAIGQYSFNTPGNQGIELLKYQSNSWYYLDVLTIGGTISSLDFSNSIASPFSLVLRKSITGERVYSRDIGIPLYSESRELSVFTNSDKGSDPKYPGGPQRSDILVADLGGILNQISSTVGIAQISLSLVIAIFQMDLASYNEAMRQPVTAKFSQQLR